MSQKKASSTETDRKQHQAQEATTATLPIQNPLHWFLYRLHALNTLTAVTAGMQEIYHVRVCWYSTEGTICIAGCIQT